MSDPVLKERLNALEQKLKDLEKDPSCWGVFEFKNLQLSSEIKSGLCKALRDEARVHRASVVKVRQKLEQSGDVVDPAGSHELVKQAWKGYTRTHRQCRLFFRECLEVIGGLAVRDMNIPMMIYHHLADELIKGCAEDSTVMGSLAPTVPALPETMVKPLARIIGLRFPEWTIWTLPFTAHELGHVVVGNDDQLEAFVSEKAKEWAPGKEKKRNERYLREYLADAFGTYTMGPAYACAAIRLGLNPSTAYHDKDECPMDAKRAHVVFAILKRMNEMVVDKPYNHISERLEHDWQEMLGGIGENPMLIESDRCRMDSLVTEILAQFREFLRPTAMYWHGERDHTFGWLVAQGWCNKWSEQMKDRGPLKIGDISRRSTLRDVLNAAWQCRLNHPEESDMIAEAAQALCEEIIQKKREPAGDGGARGVRH